MEESRGGMKRLREEEDQSNIQPLQKQPRIEIEEKKEKEKKEEDNIFSKIEMLDELKGNSDFIKNAILVNPNLLDRLLSNGQKLSDMLNRIEVEGREREKNDIFLR